MTDDTKPLESLDELERYIGEHIASKLHTDGTKPAPTEALDEVARIDHDIGLWRAPAADDALPEPVLLRRVWPDHYWYGDVYGYTADQMRAAIAAERERLAQARQMLQACQLAMAESMRFYGAGGTNWDAMIVAIGAAIAEGKS